MKSPMVPIDRMANWWAHRGLRRETIAPTRRLFLATAVTLALVVAASFATAVVDHWSGIVARVLLGAIAGAGVMMPLNRRLAYRRGWFAGREAMYDSMLEARRRGFAVEEWVSAEVQRDILDGWGGPGRVPRGGSTAPDRGRGPSSHPEEEER